MQLLLASLLAYGTVARAATVSVGAPATAPTDASNVVDHAFIGFGIESTDFPEYTNAFAQNLINNIQSRTGSPVNLRVGGTSMDHTIFDLKQTTAVTNTSYNPNVLQQNFTFGAPWFSGFKTMKNVTYTLHFAIARAYGQNHTNVVEFTQECLNDMGPSNLLVIGVGNEPDLYVHQIARNPGYGPADYANELKSYMNDVEGNVTGVPPGRVFQIFDKSSGGSWPIAQVMANATSQNVSFGQVASVAEHYYQTTFGDSVQDTLLNHAVTTSQTQSAFGPSISYLKQHNPNLKFVLDEVGCALGDTPDYHLCASLATGVWTVDWLLYTMSINVSRVNMQNVATAPFSAWLPRKNVSGTGIFDPHVQGSWYGEVLVASFIGPNTTNSLQVSELKTSNANVTAYAGFHAGKLAKVVLTNQAYWKPGQGARPSDVITLALPGVAATQATVRRLTGPSGDALQNITFAGLDWPYPGDQVQVFKGVETVNIKGGATTITINATEAILVEW